MSKLTERLEGLFEPLLKTMGLAVVRILATGSSHIKLQVMIERIDEAPVSMENCVEASHEISNLLDIEDPIENAYTLEVTSPGIDRPLVKPDDFKRFAGLPVHVTLFAPMEDGRRKIKGILADSDEAFFNVTIEEEDISIRIAYSEISKAKLEPEIHFNKKG